MSEFQAAPLPADCVPPQICEGCAAGALWHVPTQSAAVYCTHTLTAAVYPMGGSWTVIPNIELEHFKNELVRLLTRAELCGDVALALQQCVLESQIATRH